MTTRRDEQTTQPAPAASDTPDAGRRRFVVAGVIAAPIIATLAARPASAGVTTGSLGNYASGAAAN